MSGIEQSGSGPAGTQAGARSVDVAIVGGGFAGSLAAALLGQAGHRVALVDVNRVYPPDFRCEKLAGEQPGLLRDLGLFACMEAVAKPIDYMHVARFGQLVERMPSREYGFPYEDLVNAVRKRIPASVDFIAGRVEDIAASDDRQHLVLSNGGAIDARLAILASGPLDGLQQKLGIARRVIRNAHSLTIGFDIAPAGRAAFAFPALTYYGDRLAQRIGYVSFFPVGDVMRANLFCYRGHDAEWARAFRDNPRETLFATLPGLRRLTGEIEVVGKVKIRRTDLYVTENHRRGGVVLVGDAFQSTCPAAGNGTTRVMTDVGQLCRSYVPQWLGTAGMGPEKIAQFYDDPVKLACDRDCSRLAEYGLSFATDRGVMWRARRLRAYLRPRMRSVLKATRTPAGPDLRMPA
jgi:2-polyprenyl-6-methoxyphenol hydroxylase-like FAD-dependent oxidoreductase